MYVDDFKVFLKCFETLVTLSFAKSEHVQWGNLEMLSVLHAVPFLHSCREVVTLISFLFLSFLTRVHPSIDLDNREKRRLSRISEYCPGREFMDKPTAFLSK